MADLWADLLECLDLTGRPATGAPDVVGSRHGTTFEGRNQSLSYHRLFGGQLLAQFVRAARLACPGKGVKSLHALFPSAGRADEPVRYDVELHREGTSFAALTVSARQTRGVIATALLSLHATEQGRDHQTVPDVPALPGAEHQVELDLLPWQTRCTADLDAPGTAPPTLDLWMRTPAVDPELATALTAYATDLTLIGTALRPLDGIGQRDAGTKFTSAVTSHTIWFHRPFRTDGWLLHRQHSPILAHSRAFGRGDVLTEDGRLVASYAQEALLRFQP
jgi:acyl-CoA thioesterase II